MSQGPSCALTHPAGLHQLVGQSRRWAQPSHMKSTERNQGEQQASQEQPCRTQFPSIFLPQDIRVLLLLLNTLRTSYELERGSLVLDPPEFGGALIPLQNHSNRSQHGPVHLAGLGLGNTGLSKPEKWFSLRGCALSTAIPVKRHTWTHSFWNKTWPDTIYFIPLDSSVSLALRVG